MGLLIGSKASNPFAPLNLVPVSPIEAAFEDSTMKSEFFSLVPGLPLLLPFLRDGPGCRFLLGRNYSYGPFLPGPRAAAPPALAQGRAWYSVDDDNSKRNDEVLEDRDPSYEAMLNKMVGKISSKPGGKLEMGEANVVQKPKRPLPKVRNTTPETGRYEERPVAAGTLNVAQFRHIMRLHQGKADEHDGPLGLKEVAERFQVDAVQLEKILQYVSLPPEDNTNRKKHELED